MRSSYPIRVFAIARRVLPDMEIHISTQANTNYGTYLFWHGLGARRVVSARELSLAEIREIRDHIPQDMQIESFIHGAMCISYSGRCLLSNYFVKGCQPGGLHPSLPGNIPLWRRPDRENICLYMNE